MAPLTIQLLGQELSSLSVQATRVAGRMWPKTRQVGLSRLSCARTVALMFGSLHFMVPRAHVSRNST